MATFGERLKILRNEKDITLEHLAIEICSTKATLSRYENSKRVPNIDFALKIAEYFKVTTDYIYGLTDDRQGIVSKFGDILGFAEKSLTNAKALRDYIQFLNSQNNKID
jgi:transcriptional regulator with XRE-family HTH domain